MVLIEQNGQFQIFPPGNGQNCTEVIQRSMWPPISIVKVK